MGTQMKGASAIGGVVQQPEKPKFWFAPKSITVRNVETGQLVYLDQEERLPWRLTFRCPDTHRVVFRHLYDPRDEEGQILL